jgi:hypothetical protein
VLNSRDVIVPADKTELIDLIATVPTEQGYTSHKKWYEVQTALVAANAVVVDIDATQADVDTAYYNLQSAYSMFDYRFIGDANGDEIITALDITAIQNYILGGTQLTGLDFYLADANEDKNITALDITAIQNHILGGTQITAN